ncbi:ribonuclease Y [bacterium]|nr:ribonuclease Y [bacterium]
MTLELPLNIIITILVLLTATVFLAINWTRNVERIKVLLQKQEEMTAEFEKKAESLEKAAAVKAKDELQRQYKDLDEEIRERRQEINKIEVRLARREDQIEEQAQIVSDKEYQLNKKTDELIEKEDYLSEIITKQIAELERISGLNREDAKRTLLEQLQQDLAQERNKIIRESEQIIKETAEEKAREILTQSMQKCAVDQAIETTVSVVPLPAEDMKGRIIGREGRNIRTLETISGVDLIIDDTPEAVVLSCFDPVKREIARLTIEKLVADGRIHPVRIEEMYEKSKKEIEKKIIQEGERAALDLGIMNLNKELTKTLGRLYYRTSYGQNVLRHSIEVAQIAGNLATELGANVKYAKRAGLLHDIGKAVDQTQEGTHIQLGVELARQYGEKEEIIHAIEAHHDDVACNTLEAAVVKIADAVSAARPGARRDTLEIYIKRLKQLEEIATSFEGIKQSFAVQAGREVRVIVQPEAFDDVACAKLARDIVKRIEDEMEYPGQVRVTVVREARVVEIAK